MASNGDEGFYILPFCNQSDVSRAERRVRLPVLLMKTEICLVFFSEC